MEHITVTITNICCEQKCIVGFVTARSRERIEGLPKAELKVTVRVPVGSPNESAGTMRRRIRNEALRYLVPS